MKFVVYKAKRLKEGTYTWQQNFIYILNQKVGV